MVVEQIIDFLEPSITTPPAGQADLHDL